MHHIVLVSYLLHTYSICVSYFGLPKGPSRIEAGLGPDVGATLARGPAASGRQGRVGSPSMKTI